MAANKLLKWKYFIVIFLIVLLGIFLFNYKNFTGNSIFRKSITGNIVLEASTVYKPNSSLEGDFKFSLKQGELLPVDSKILISLNDNSYEYVLSDLVSNDKVEGNFYLDNADISGSGEGYGSPSSDEVNFVMKITKKSEQTEETTANENSGNESNNSNQEITNRETIGTTSEETITTETATNENSNTNSETIPSVTETTSDNGNKEENKPLENEPLKKVPKDENKNSETEEEKSENIENPIEPSTNSEPINVEVNSAPITGNAVSRIFRFFRFTGKATSEISEEISGSVSKDSPYTYELKGGETAEIVSSDQPVDISIDGKTVRITTGYEGGFGKDAIGENIYGLKVDLSELNINAEEGDLKISLVYNGQEITSVSKTISIESSEQTTNTNESVSNVTVSNETIVNQTTNVTNVTNVTIIQGNLTDYSLTDEELASLKIKIGSDKVSIVKSEVINGRLIIRFKIGDYWLENSYDNSMNKKDLDYQIGLDMTKWVKFLVQSLNKGESKSENVESYLGEFNLSASSQSSQNIQSTLNVTNTTNVSNA
ncbi:MAG: hypothetical protein AABW91_00070 [Nanoarchaeota archaeon]